jgi:mitochondrial import receptor subunit TOM40
VFVRAGFFELLQLKLFCEFVCSAGARISMASSVFPSEKLGLNDPSPSQPHKTPYLAAISPLTSLFGRFSEWRKSLDLPNPGTVENLQKEVKRTCFQSPAASPLLTSRNVYLVTHLTNFMFDGARADLTKGLSVNPAFQISHSFTLGSQVATPSYNFGAVYATSNVSLDLLTIFHAL